MTGAGPLATPRRRLLAVVAVVAVALGVVAATGLRDTLVYYRTPSEVAGAPPEASERFRLAGLVVHGTLRRSGDTVSFVLTDGVRDVVVEHRGDAPQMLHEGQGAVVEGSLAGAVFRSDSVMVRHSNEYRAPDVAAP